MESPISRALLASSMPQNRRNETIPPIQSKDGAPRDWIALTAGSTITKYSEHELRQDVAQYRPDGSRPTHGVPMESAGHNSTLEASAKTDHTSTTHEGNNTNGSNAVYGGIQNFTGATVSFVGSHRPKAPSKNKRSKVQESRSSKKDKAADVVEGGAHHKHVGDNDNGVNALYGGEQNFENGNISFGATEKRG